MKKTIIALTAFTLVLTLSGCAGSGTQNSDSAIETTVSATTEDTTAATEETLTETVTEAETSAETSDETTADSTSETTALTETTAENGDQVTPITDEAPLIALTKKLLLEYQEIDSICAFGLATDSNDTYQPEGSDAVYQRVTGEFESIDDLKRYFAQTLTGDEKEKIENSVFGCEIPIYIEHDGKLYMANGGRGSNMNYVMDTIKVSNITKDGYTATFKNEELGGELTDHTATVVRIDGEYLISSIK